MILFIRDIYNVSNGCSLDLNEILIISRNFLTWELLRSYFKNKNM